MFGIRYFAPSGLMILWLCHLIGLHSILMYYTPSGLILHSPERALFLNDGYSPSDRERTTITSPERALNLNGGCSPSERERTTIASPERALNLNGGCSPSDRERTTIISPERALYISKALTALAKWKIYITDAVSPLAIKTQVL